MLSTNHRAGVGSVEGLPNLSSGSCPPLLTGMLMGKAHVLSESQSYGPLEHWEDERTPLADEALAAPADCDWTRDEETVTLDGFDVDVLKVEVGAELLKGAEDCDAITLAELDVKGAAGAAEMQSAETSR